MGIVLRNKAKAEAAVTSCGVFFIPLSGPAALPIKMPQEMSLSAKAENYRGTITFNFPAESIRDKIATDRKSNSAPKIAASSGRTNFLEC